MTGLIGVYLLQTIAGNEKGRASRHAHVFLFVARLSAQRSAHPMIPTHR
jgi:hypothetical protein